MVTFKNLVPFITSRQINFGYTSNLYRSLGTKSVPKTIKQTENFENVNPNEWELALPYKSIPGPGRWSFIRSFLQGGQFHGKSRQYMAETLHHKYGDLVKIQGLLKQKDVIFAFDPNYFQKIYRHDGIWPSRRGLETLTYYRHELRPEIFKETGTLLTSNGEEWGRLRSIVNPIMMQPKTVRIYVPKVDRTAKNFIERMRQLRDSNTFELPGSFETELNAWSLEQICVIGLDTELRIIGNEDMNSDAQKLIRAIYIIFSLLGELEFKPSLWKYYETPNLRKLIKAYNILADISMKYIEEAFERYKLIEKYDKRSENEKSIVERLIKINKKVAVIVAMEMFFAGVDTTTTAITTCMLSLAKNPDKQEILRQEIRKILPDSDTSITEQKLKNLPYLRAVIKESIRKYPVLQEHIRTTQVDFVLGNYQIPKNTDIIMYNSHLYNDSNYFSEPDKFIPERWLRTQEKNIYNENLSKCPVSATKSLNPFAYLPFGFGNRMCVGKRLVDMELEILLARMVLNFNIEYNYDEKDLFKLGLIYTPAKELKFKITDIKN